VNDAIALEPLPPELILQPLAWLSAEHQRCRRVCGLISQIAVSRQVLHDEMVQVLAFLRSDLPLHLADEDEGLFPVLRLRCDPEDELGRVIKALAAGHGRDVAAIAEIARLLDEAVRLKRPIADPAAQSLLQDFAVRLCDQMALENAVVLPIARRRLDQDDLAHLSQTMARRRGIDG